ncbi:MAG TPA: WxcM-like domain-containing protein [Marmoricola sp.]|nr:WxcM-like domain-containing protein [Marmoricola sp.]
MSSHPAFGEFSDSRGHLQAIELDLAPFAPRRAFLVTGPPGGAWRGDHHVPCRQWLLLLQGSVDVKLRAPDGTSQTHRLDQVGQGLELTAGDFVRYYLRDQRCRVIVFADAPYAGKQ